MSNKKILVIICLTLLIELFFVDYISYIFVFRPAYISTKLDCSPELQNDESYLILGSFNPNTNQIEINCEITYDTLEFRKILAHEKTHREQWEEHRYASCDGLLNIGVFFNEVESKVSEFFVT